MRPLTSTALREPIFSSPKLNNSFYQSILLGRVDVATCRRHSDAHRFHHELGPAAGRVPTKNENGCDERQTEGTQREIFHGGRRQEGIESNERDPRRRSQQRRQRGHPERHRKLRTVHTDMQGDHARKPDKEVDYNHQPAVAHDVEVVSSAR